MFLNVAGASVDVICYSEQIDFFTSTLVFVVVSFRGMSEIDSEYETTRRLRCTTSAARYSIGN